MLSVVFVVGPPRCGLHSIAAQLAEKLGARYVPGRAFNLSCAKMLAPLHGVYRRGSTKQEPLPWVQFQREGAYAPAAVALRLAELRTEAGVAPHQSTTLVVTSRISQPLFASLNSMLGDRIAWLCVDRDPQKVEASCVATRWMPRLAPGEWETYASFYRAAISHMVKQHPRAFRVDSDAIFSHNTSQLESAVAQLREAWKSEAGR